MFESRARSFFSERFPSRKRQIARERLSAALDEMIADFEGSEQHRPPMHLLSENERMVNGVTYETLEMAGRVRPSGSRLTYYVTVSTVATGKRRGWMSACIVVRTGYRLNSLLYGVVYPEHHGRMLPPAWLTDRLQKLRRLVAEAKERHARA